VVLAVVIAGAVLAVLIQFDVTRSVAQALLASSAVIAIFAGLAFNVPLSNLGSGLLVAFSQPLRLGDRVTIGEHTGFVEDISLLYTTLATDLELRVAIPNAQLTDGPIVNRTIEDPRRAVTASFLVPITVDVERALEVLRASTLSVTPLHDQLHVEVGDIVTAAALRIARLDVRAFAPLEADVFALASDIRRAGLAALRAESLLE
jgi:small-conductance mechanosensitive channel